MDKYPIRLAIIITYDNRLQTLINKVEFIEQQILNSDSQLIEIDLREKKQ